MPIVKCQCGKQYKVADDSVGKQIVCKSCGATIPVNATVESAAPVHAGPIAASGSKDWTEQDLAKIGKLKKAHDVIVG